MKTFFTHRSTNVYADRKTNDLKNRQVIRQVLRSCVLQTEIKANWLDPEMKISNVPLEGDAGSGKTQLAKALSFDLQLPYIRK